MANLNIKFNNKNYSIDPASLADATARLEAHLTSMMEERLEGDGAEFYTLAPTALSFRSTAPLNELQEVQINGVTVDPANYTLEEGSTIVTFPIDYLKTLNVGSYEVAVASEGKTVKGGFTVVAPELNEHGFYYNQPYTAEVPAFGGNVVFFLREEGIMDVIVLDNGYVEACSYTADGSNLTINATAGTFAGTASESGIYFNELYTNFVLGDTSIAADKDYIYFYKEDLGGYEVAVINKTKTEYGAIKTGINGIDTVSIGNRAFSSCTSLKSIEIPASVTSIGERVFEDCTSLASVTFAEGSQLTSIGIWAFFGCKSLKSIEIPTSVTSISNQAFSYCTSLKSIEIPASVTSIDNGAFSGCKSLTSVTIPNSVTIIGDSAFSSCASLASIEIPVSVTNIGGAAFDYCTSLTSIEIPASVTSIGSWVFSYCTSITSINFDGTMEQWNAITKGVAWNKNVPATHVHCTDGDVAL